MTVVWWAGEATAQRMRRAAMKGIVKGCEGVRNEAIRSIQTGPKTGRIYRRRGIEHQASAPGEAPASDTGRLVNSITTNYEPDKLSGTIQFGTEYAPYLEYGTQKMEPRPFARPALDNQQDNIVAGITDEIVKEFT